MQPLFDRGYTGHEHMCGFGLINMNGRLYDPYLQRFLSPDPYVQEPFNLQNYNRYAYCLNNPLMYTDPSGESFIAFAVGFIIGAYFGGSLANKNLNPLKWDYNNSSTGAGIIFGGLAGGFSAAMSWGVISQGYSFNLSIGAGFGSIQTGVGNAINLSANFLVSNSGVILNGIGYTTIAGGGAFLAYNTISNSWGGGGISDSQISSNFQNSMNEWRRNNRRPSFWVGPLTVTNWEYVFENTFVAQSVSLDINVNALGGSGFSIGYVFNYHGEGSWFFGSVAYVGEPGVGIGINSTVYFYTGDSTWDISILEGDAGFWQAGGTVGPGFAGVDVMYNRVWNNQAGYSGNGIYIGLGASTVPFVNGSAGYSMMKFLRKRR